MPMHIAVTTNITGTMLKVMRESFHCTVRATMNAEQNVERAWTTNASFSAIPWLTLFPLVVTWVAIAPVDRLSKCHIS